MTASNPPRPLDESLYEMKQDEEELLSSLTGIKDAGELKQHVLAVQSEIYKIHPYYCIFTFGFVRLKMCRYPAYTELLKLGRERPGALFLDLGCCVGQDLRKAVADGFPISQMLACDLHPEFWDTGHKLFKSTPETFPVPFIQADIFDPASLAPLPVPSAPPSEPPAPRAPPKTLTPLAGSLAAIHASYFFHLFAEEQQAHAARLIAPLLSPAPGSMIFGGHVGRPERGLHGSQNTHGIPMFCHSPESWRALWAGVFPEGQVRVDAHLEEFTRADHAVGDFKGYLLVWCVTRV